MVKARKTMPPLAAFPQTKRRMEERLGEGLRSVK